MKINKKYTKKQILESIKYWKKQLNEGRYREGNTIYADSSGVINDESNTLSKIGQDAQVITVDEWKRDKLFPTEQIEKCESIYDLKDIYDKYKKQYILVRFDVGGELGDVIITPIDAKDGAWLKREFGPGSVW